MGKGGDVDIPEFQRIDLEELQRLAQTTAEDNLANSIRLERQYDPQMAELRRLYKDALGQDLGLDTTSYFSGLDTPTFTADYLAALQGGQGAGDIVAGSAALREGLNREAPQVALPELVQSELEKNVYDKILSNLNLGGGLSRDVQNEVARRALATGWATGLQGGQAGRDIVARDLGISSLGLEQSRLAQAQQQAAQEQAKAQQQQSLAASINTTNAQLQQAQNAQNQSAAATLAGVGSDQQSRLLQALGLQDAQSQQNFANQMALAESQAQSAGQDATRRLGISQLLQSQGLPVAGLDPGQLASAAVADQNAMNQYNQNAAAIQYQSQQSNNQALGNILGTALGLGIGAATGGTGLTLLAAGGLGGSLGGQTGGLF